VFSQWKVSEVQRIWSFVESVASRTDCRIASNIAFNGTKTNASINAYEYLTAHTLGVKIGQPNTNTCVYCVKRILCKQESSWILDLRIDVFCKLVSKETSKETCKNRNSLVWLRNAGSYLLHVCMHIYVYIFVLTRWVKFQYICHSNSTHHLTRRRGKLNIRPHLGHLRRSNSESASQ